MNFNCYISQHERKNSFYIAESESRLPSVDERTLVLITGARQTGKTTLARGKYSGLEYFNLDAMEIRDDLAAVGTYDWARSVGKAIVDEAQKLPSVFEKIKYAFDASPKMSPWSGASDSGMPPFMRIPTGYYFTFAFYQWVHPYEAWEGLEIRICPVWHPDQ